MSNTFYDASTKEKFNRTVRKLFAAGFQWVGLNKNPSFEDCKKNIHGNGKLIINAFYNDINGKNEIQYGTRAIYNTYPQYNRKIKVIFEDGDFLYTKINGSKDDVRSYYIGKFFNCGTVEDNMRKCVDVEFLN